MNAGDRVRLFKVRKGQRELTKPGILIAEDVDRARHEAPELPGNPLQERWLVQQDDSQNVTSAWIAENDVVEPPADPRPRPPAAEALWKVTEAALALDRAGLSGDGVKILQSGVIQRLAVLMSGEGNHGR